MNIKLEKDIILYSNENEFQLRKETGVDKKGRITYKTYGFYSTLDGALNGYVKYMTRMSGATTVQELHKELERIKGYIRDFTIKVKNGEAN